MESDKEKKQSFFWKIRPIKLNKLLLNSLFVVALLILISISFAYFFQLKTLSKSNHWVVHTYKVMQNVDNALYALARMESAQRGYLITHNSIFLNEVKEIRPTIENHLKTIKYLTEDNPDQNNRAVTFANLMEKRITLMLQLADLKDKNQFDTPDGLAVFYENNEISEHIKNLGEEIKSVEQVLLLERNKAMFK